MAIDWWWLLIGGLALIGVGAMTAIAYAWWWAVRAVRDFQRWW